MKKEFIKVLEKLEENGYVSYVVGGYVRDVLLNKKTSDIDIITNALPKDIKKIFNNIDHEYSDYGSVKLKVKDHLIDITTFRRELSYSEGKPTNIEYINSLEEDLKRRDFTINTLCMDKDQNVVDLLNAKEDLDNKVLRTIRNADVELIEDPTRILRALRFMNNLNMNLDKELEESIIRNKHLIREINVNKRKEEIDKILKHKNIKRFIHFIKENNLEKDLGIVFNSDKSYSFIVSYYATSNIIDNYNFTKNEKNDIKEIKSLINKGKIDKIDLYKKGLFISVASGEILNINKKELIKEYNDLPIKETKDICLTPSEICLCLNINPSKNLGLAIKKIEKAIIEGKIENTKEDIINFLKRK